MNIINFVIDNWYMLVAAAAVIGAVALWLWHFAKKPSAEQMKKVRQWLLWAVTKAEKELGGGTGALKLRQVYDMFLARFPWMAKVIPFVQFCNLVDDALVEMRKLLEEYEDEDISIEAVPPSGTSAVMRR